jgi:hypothetical protein
MNQTSDRPAEDFIRLAVYATQYPQVICQETMNEILAPLLTKVRPGSSAHRTLLALRKASAFPLVYETFTQALLQSNGKVTFDAFITAKNKVFGKYVDETTGARAAMVRLFGVNPEEIEQTMNTSQYERFQMSEPYLLDLARAVAHIQGTATEKITQENFGKYFWDIVADAETLRQGTIAYLKEDLFTTVTSKPIAYLITLQTEAREALIGFDGDKFLLDTMSQVRKLAQKHWP